MLPFPFYFFAAGLKFHAADFGWGAVGVAGAFLVIIVPVRIAAVALHRKAVLSEDCVSLLESASRSHRNGWGARRPRISHRETQTRIASVGLR